MRCMHYLHTAFTCNVSLACMTVLTPALPPSLYDAHIWSMLTHGLMLIEGFLKYDDATQLLF